jgi:hypothetical protein
VALRERRRRERVRLVVRLARRESARNVFLNAFRPGDRARLVERAGPLAASTVAIWPP